MKELREKLLKIMAGTSAQKWIDRRDLLAKTGASEAQLDVMLLALHEERAINRAQVIRGDTVIYAIWITGVIAKIPRSVFTINPNKLPQSGSLARSEPTVTKEKSMKESEQKTAVTTKHIRDLVIACPGIKHDDVYQALVFSDGSNKKKVGDLISALISTKQLTKSSKDGIKRLHPGERLNDVLAKARPAKPKAEAKPKAPAAKLLTGEAAKPFQEASTKGIPAIPAIPNFLLKSEKPTAPNEGKSIIVWDFTIRENGVICIDINASIGMKLVMAKVDAIKLKRYLNAIDLKAL